LPLQFFLIRLDLHLTLYRPLLVHHLFLPKCLLELTTAALSPRTPFLALRGKATGNTSPIDSA
jgi:hypothetical protein